MTNSFSPILRCRYIRVHPKSWYRHIAMRVEFYGCRTSIVVVFNFPVPKIDASSEIYAQKRDYTLTQF